jgi:hypothetical protein
MTTDRDERRLGMRAPHVGPQRSTPESRLLMEI